MTLKDSWMRGGTTWPWGLVALQKWGTLFPASSSSEKGVESETYWLMTTWTIQIDPRSRNTFASFVFKLHSKIVEEEISWRLNFLHPLIKFWKTQRSKESDLPESDSSRFGNTLQTTKYPVLCLGMPDTFDRKFRSPWRRGSSYEFARRTV